MRRRRREVDALSLSFLDAICCGFGAVILLLVISKVVEPVRLEESRIDLQSVLARYEEELHDIIGETERVVREREETQRSLEQDRVQIAELQRELMRIRAAISEQDDADFTNELAGRLAQAKQTLTEEMRRLLANRPDPKDYKVGGIPVDSEYIVFVIDTSGSMKQFMWDRVMQQIRETLEVYPTVKGIQVLNDEGEYLFKSYRNEWIPDSPSRREAILDALRSWDAFSNSNPREGILKAIDAFYDPNKKISIYVYSDDFASGTGSINAVVREVDRRNRADASGNRRVRIHAVAFPAIYAMTGQLYSAAQYATLMRVLCQRNGGTFIALPLNERRR